MILFVDDEDDLRLAAEQTLSLADLPARVFADPEAVLAEIGRPENVGPWLDRQLANKAKIWGMGHREYKVKDPRATIHLFAKLATALPKGRS